MSNLITGAFSFSGKFIAQELINIGEKVITITGHPDYNSPYFGEVDIKSYEFNNFRALVNNFKGIDTFYNSYWIRFPYKETSWRDAIINSYKLFKACKLAGVKKIVHISVTNPSLDSPYAYFKGKAVVEELLKRSGVKYTILRISWMFEEGDILVNNIAWILRRFPIFGIFGDGQYKLQPVSLKTLGKVAVENRYLGNQTINVGQTINVIGPETYTYSEFISIINKTINCKTLLFPFPGISKYIPIFISKILSMILSDRLLTIDEVNTLKDNLLLTSSYPSGNISFEKWLIKNKTKLGLKWSNEIKRHYN